MYVLATMHRKLNKTQSSTSVSELNVFKEYNINVITLLRGIVAAGNCVNTTVLGTGGERGGWQTDGQTGTLCVAVLWCSSPVHNARAHTHTRKQHTHSHQNNY